MALRTQRTTYALRYMGGTVLGSAATTVGCTIFLLFCTLTIFQKFGAVVLVVTLLSVIASLAPLPALLLIAGPLRAEHPCVALCNILQNLICRRRKTPLGVVSEESFSQSFADGVMEDDPPATMP